MIGATIKISAAGVLLTLLTVITMVIVNEEYSAWHGYGGGVLLREEDLTQDTLFDELTGASPASQVPETALFRVQERPDEVVESSPPPPPPAEAITIEKGETKSAAVAKQPDSERVCLERAAQVCTNHPPKCKKHGPSCSYEKTCILRSPRCKKTGICTKPGKRCHHSFSSDCVACAQRTDSCHKAQQIAKNCVPQCRKGCQKDADCEQKCAKGCLQRYHSGMRRCKTLCKACHKGSTKVCWDGCGEWKSCARRTDKPECTIKDECVKKEDSCTFDKTCKKWVQRCEMVDKCVSTKKVCKETTACVQKAAECTTDYTPECSSCRKEKKGCQGLDAIKEKCSGDCRSWCAESSDKTSCLQKCSKACDTQSASLVELCQEQCPVCKKKQGPCKFKCLKHKKSKKCDDVCKDTKKVKHCHKVCKEKHKDENSKHCTKQCIKWSPRKICKHPCQEWKRSKERPCHYPCTQHAFQRSCDEGEAVCVKWSAAVRSCVQGACLKYQDKPSAAEPATKAPTVSQVSKVAAEVAGKVADKTVSKIANKVAGKVADLVIHRGAEDLVNKSAQGLRVPPGPGLGGSSSSRHHSGSGSGSGAKSVTEGTNSIAAAQAEIAALKAALAKANSKLNSRKSASVPLVNKTVVNKTVVANNKVVAPNKTKEDASVPVANKTMVNKTVVANNKTVAPNKTKEDVEDQTKTVNAYSSAPAAAHTRPYQSAAAFELDDELTAIPPHRTATSDANNIQATIDRTSNFIDAVLGSPHQEPEIEVSPATPQQSVHLLGSSSKSPREFSKHDRVWEEATAQSQVDQAVKHYTASKFKAKASEQTQKITKRIKAKAKHILQEQVKGEGHAALATTSISFHSDHRPDERHAPQASRTSSGRATTAKAEAAKAESDLASSQAELRRAMSVLSSKHGVETQFFEQPG